MGQVLFQKYRPSTFDELHGQECVVKSLKNAVKCGSVGQVYLFCGLRGTGKTSAARILSKAVNCENNVDGNPCNRCNSCLSGGSGANGIFELDAASNNSVDDIRGIIEQVRFIPAFSKFNVFIIDEVHMLSQSAFNAFLKTLEEPPVNVIFILATTEYSKVPSTVVSRCQVFNFRNISERDIVNNLRNILEKEKVQYQDSALNIIAQKADGSMRDALSITESLISYSNSITYDTTVRLLGVLGADYYLELCQYIIKKDSYRVILYFDKIIQSGYDGVCFLNGLLNHFRNLLLVKSDNVSLLFQWGDDEKGKYIEQTKSFSVDYINKSIVLINEWSASYRTALNKRFYVESLLIKLVIMISR